MTNIYNLFKFLEDKKGRDIPLNVKLELKPDEITSDDISRVYDKGIREYKGPLKFIRYGKVYFLLDDKGRISLKRWFDFVSDFHDGFARVEIKNKGYNFINTNGDFLSPDLWFDFVSDFHDGFAWVYIRNKGWYFINTKGELYHEDKKTKLTPKEVEELKKIQNDKRI